MGTTSALETAVPVVRVPQAGRRPGTPEPAVQPRPGARAHPGASAVRREAPAVSQATSAQEEREIQEGRINLVLAELRINLVLAERRRAASGRPAEAEAGALHQRRSRYAASPCQTPLRPACPHRPV